jgi:hypothetical protein
MEANQTTHPTLKAGSTVRTFFPNAYVPPDSGNCVASSAKLRAVSTAIRPLSANATIALGPVVANATPANARIPPPTIAPTPIPVAPSSPIERWMSERSVIESLASHTLRASVANCDPSGQVDWAARFWSRTTRSDIPMPSLRCSNRSVFLSRCFHQTTRFTDKP